jgi:hypothetical protein
VSDLIQKKVIYDTSVTMCYKATSICPVSGNALVAYGDTVDDTRRGIDFQILAECERRGITIQGRLTADEITELKMV